MSKDKFKLNIYQLYHKNECQFGFYVRRNSWHPSRFAKVTDIELATEGKRLRGKAPYFGGFNYPKGHIKEGKRLGPRLVTLEADWLDNGIYITNSGGTYAWEQVFPNNK